MTTTTPSNTTRPRRSRVVGRECGSALDDTGCGTYRRLVTALVSAPGRLDLRRIDMVMRKIDLVHLMLHDLYAGIRVLPRAENNVNDPTAGGPAALALAKSAFAELVRRLNEMAADHEVHLF